MEGENRLPTPIAMITLSKTGMIWCSVPVAQHSTAQHSGKSATAHATLKLFGAH